MRCVWRWFVLHLLRTSKIHIICFASASKSSAEQSCSSDNCERYRRQLKKHDFTVAYEVKPQLSWEKKSCSCLHHCSSSHQPCVHTHYAIHYPDTHVIAKKRLHRFSISTRRIFRESLRRAKERKRNHRQSTSYIWMTSWLVLQNAMFAYWSRLIVHLRYK